MNLLDRTFLLKYLEKYSEVPFSICSNDGKLYTLGMGDPKFTIKLNNDIKKTNLLKSTSLALGEAYMNGNLEILGDLYDTLNYFMGQMSKFSVNTKALKSIIRPSKNIKSSKNQISYHYDIGNDFYSLWLDDTLSYSCAYFKSESDSLYDAQVNKVHHILKKLNLEEGMSLLDIGCGWGYLLIEAAKKYKVHGLGITLSKEQADKFSERIKEEHLENYLEVLVMDYRELKSSSLLFDRIVSVGMLEHVGRDNYNEFIQCVNSVLKANGVFLLHYISGKKEGDGDPWIKKYIFPGGVIPSLREIINLCSEYDMSIVDVESLRRHYNKTLLCWNKNFQANKEKIAKKFDDKFIRMWELYLCSCATSFNKGFIDLHQILMTKGANNNLPMTRDYMI